MTDVAINMADWALRIAACWRRGAESVIEAGRLLSESKTKLGDDEFENMVRDSLPFGKRTAERLMAIAADERLTGSAAHVSLLPPHWGTIYELTKLDDAELHKHFEDGTINPDMERSEAAGIVKKAKLKPQTDAYNARVDAGCTLEDLELMVAARRKFGVIYADPPWLFETYSEKGQDRKPGYKTDPLDPIKKLPVKELAADNCVLFIWVLMNQLPQAFEVIDAWGFEFKTCAFTWVKQNQHNDKPFLGMGYWTRANAELCLLATKGTPTRLDAGVPQVLLSKIMEHSRKPEEFANRIERLVGGPYLELYARRERDGWTSWGNEIERARFLAQFEAETLSPLLEDVHDAETGEIIEMPPAEPPVIAQPGEAEEPRLNSDEALDIPNFLRRVPVASASNANASVTGPPHEV